MEENQTPISENQREAEPALRPLEGAKKGRGGKRPGAGAPKGNMNALKHGLRSKQFAKIGALIAESADVQQTLLQIAERWENKKLKANQVAATILAQVITRGLQRGDDRVASGLEGLIVLPPVDDRRSISQRISRGDREKGPRNVSDDPDAQHAAPDNCRSSAEINQTSDTTPADNQSVDTKSD